MPAIAPKFGTLSLDDAFYDTARWDEQTGQRTNEQEIPRRHGVKMADQLMLKAKTIPVRGRIVGTTQAEARTKLDGLLGKLFSLGEDKLYLWDDRYVNAALKVCSIKYVENAAVRVLDFVLNFLAADLFQYNTTPVTGAAVLTAAWTDRIIDIEATAFATVAGIGYHATAQKFRQTWIPTKNVLSRIEVFAHNNSGAPADDVVFDLRYSGDSYASILGTITVTSATWNATAPGLLTLDVQWDVGIDDQYTYAVEISRSGGVDGVNYRNLRIGTSDSIPSGSLQGWNGSAWIDNWGVDADLYFKTYGVQKSGNIVLATGNAPSPPTFHITAPGGTPIKAAYLKNPHASVDKWCEWFGTVAPTKELIIAMAYDERGAENDSVDAMDGFFGQFYDLAVGTNSMLYEGSPCVITVDYSDRWY